MLRMPSRHSSSSSSRAPLKESRAANHSISASFSGTKASLSSKSSSSSRKASSSERVSSSSSKSRPASGKYRGRFDDDDDIAEEEGDDQDSGDSYDEEEDTPHRQGTSRQPSGLHSKSVARPPSQPTSRQPSGTSNNANRSILARSNPNASILMAGSNTSVAFQNSRVAALARSHAVVDASSIMRPRGQAAHPTASAASTSDGAAPAAASLRVDTSSFEEWMKMATDNKINSTNTWSFALIDYFHDMSLLRNESGDGSINFQKASCTLDGCVKVWTSRVDSVVVETGKLLSGLQDDIDQASRKDKRGNDVGDDNDDDDDGDDDGTGASTRKRKRNKEATLAKTFGHIQIKKFELEFTVDPLFKKTSADFDEGGASGLLMNHLGVDSSMAVIFDASDVAGVGSDEDMINMLAVGEDDEASEHSDTPAPETPEEGGDHMVDLSKLAAKWLGSEEFGNADGASEDVGSILSRRVICPTLCNFRFSKDDDTPFGVGLDEFNQQTFHTATHADTYYDTPASGSLRAASSEFHVGGFQDDVNPLMDGVGGDVDFFGADLGGPMDDNDDDGNDGNDFFDALDTAPALHHGGPVVLDGTTGDVQDYGPFDPSADPSSELVMAMAFNPDTGLPDGVDGENGSDLFDYFDRRLMRNWAGPEHWKLSRVAAPGALGLGAASGTAAGQAAANARKESKKSKEPFIIDFLSEEGAVDVKEIFEPAKQAASITLPLNARNKMASLAASSSDAYLLPEDRHFNSRQLLRLFLKPRVAINMRRKGQQGGSFGADAQLWADVAGDGDDVGGADGGMPFDTQFFHDADDGFDANGGDMVGLDDSPANATVGGDIEDEELTQTLQALNRVKPEYVNYAKKATRVDIKKLKENIWKELGILPSTNDDPAAVAAKAADEDADESMASAQPEAAPESAKTFDSVLSGLQKAYSQDRMEEISTSFCFICLLHLANEEGLAISTGNEDKMEALRAKRGLNSATPTKGDDAGGLFGRLAAGKVIRASSEDDDLGGEEDEAAEGEEGYEEDELRVGRLSSLKIMKDPKAYRSA